MKRFSLSASVLGACLALPSPSAADDVPFFNEEFNTPSLSPGWSTWDGYALNTPSDVTNHAAFAMTGTQLSISFPGGVEHNQWWVEQAQVTRAFQGNGVYETKVDAGFDGNQQFGIVFERSPGNFMMFMLYSHNEIWGYVELFSEVDGLQYRATYPGSSTDGHNTGLENPAPGPYWLRVTLSGDPSPTNRNWKFEWSTDGFSWTTVVDGILEGENPEDNIGSIQRVGIFAGNQPEEFSANDARFDYFRTYPLSALPFAGPSSLSLTPGNGQVSLDWSTVTGADAYAIFRSNTSGGPYSQCGSATGTSYTDPSLTNGSWYHYVVAAVVEGDTSEYSPQAKGVPHILTVPPALPAGGRILALDADQLGYLYQSGERVTRWSDVYGGSGQASVQNQNNAPLYIPSALGGHAAVRFDGGDDFLGLSPGFSDFTSGITIFMVARPTAANWGSKMLLLGNGAGLANISLGRDGSSSSLQYFNSDASGTYRWFSTGNSLTNNQAALYDVLQTGGSAGGNSSATVNHNGTSVGGGTVFVPPVVTRGTNYIGRSYWNVDGNFAGDISEIIVYNRALSLSEQNAVRNYLGGKYGIAIILPPPPPLTSPAALSATAASAQVSLAWGSVPDVDGYRLYRRPASGGAFALVHQGTATSRVDPAVNGTTYVYAVRSYTATQESANSNEVTATPMAPPPPLTVPPELPAQGLALQLDAANAALEWSAGNTVTLWRDASTGAKHASASQANAPTLVTWPSGASALRFDGTDDFLNLASGFSDFTAGITLFMVARPSAIRDGAKLLLLGNGMGQANISLGRSGTSDGLQYFTNNGSGNYGWFSTGSALTTGVEDVFSLVQAGGTPNGNATAAISRNGIAVGGGTAYVPPVTERAVNYIGRSYWSVDGYFAGDIAEIILYNRVLDVAEQNAVRAYLDGKDGIDVALVPLDAPGGLVATAGNAIVDLAWNAVNGAESYKVFRRTTAGGAYALIHEGYTTSFSDLSVVNGTSYGYVVTAYAENQESAYSTEALATPMAPPPVLTPPASIPANGLVLLLDAGNAALEWQAGSQVTLWRDASSLHQDAVSTSGQAPTLVTLPGGGSALRFDGVNDYAGLPAGFQDFTAGISLFIVARPTSVQPGSKLFLMGNGVGQANISLGRDGASSNLQYFTTNSGGSYGWFPTGGALTTGETAVFDLTQPGDAANANVSAAVSKNGSAVGGGTVYVPPVTNRTVNYIGRSYWSGDGHFAGDIAEIILYNRALSPSELAAVRTYLGGKYGLSVP